ncbi:MAG: hypothetical protein [Caudoviricetes sp.]|nr:MAG: hypothetical protein [Caudoviricetes sp.]
MNIRDAVREAERVGAKGIEREPYGLFIKPTNTTDCCIICTPWKKVPRWEPNYDDLASDDWYVVPEKGSDKNV